MEPSGSAAPLADFLTARRPVGESLPDLATKALRAIRTHLGMEVAFLSEFTDGRRIFRHVDADSPDGPVQVGGSDLLKDSYCQRVVDGRLPELIQDAAMVPAAAELPATAALPVGAHLSVPIRLDDGQVYGTFCCFSTTPDLSLTDRDLAVMRVLADLLASQISAELYDERSRAEVLDRLRAVLTGDGLSMVYQPIVDLARSVPVGYEALARFTGPPICGPDIWFREAADVGLGVELEIEAIRRAVTALPRLPAQVYLAFNASPETVTSGALADALDAEPLDRLVLEITEHEAIAAYEQLSAALTPLRARGLRVAVDDAGAGYASFRHILRLAPDVIKLDLTLTRGVDTDPARRALAAAMIAFARDTSSRLVAEGVETERELATLRQLGVTAAQGYHLGRPGPIVPFTRPSPGSPSPPRPSP